jgi:excisionase family DNA binding protein
MSSDIEIHRFYKIREAAELLGLSVDQVRRLCQRGKLRCRNTGSMYLISPKALQEYQDGADDPITTAS